MLIVDSLRLSELEKLIKARYGLSLKEIDRAELKSRVYQRMRALNFKTFPEYFSLISDSNREEELLELVSWFTVGETSFFRTPAQFWVLRDYILTQIIREKLTKRKKKLRILSAGCATGEEPYSLAMVVLEKLGIRAESELEILACDINQNFLEIAQQGLYSERDLRNMDDYWRRKYFEKKGTEFRIKKPVRNLVKFFWFNLADSNYSLLSQAGLFDIIFCRNVLIYFEPRLFSQVVDKFYQLLEPEGYLFLGYSESLYGMDSKFEGIYSSGAFFYRKISSGKKSVRPLVELPNENPVLQESPARKKVSESKRAPDKRIPKLTDAEIPLTEMGSAEQLWATGYEWLEKEEYEKARIYFENLLKSAPSSPLGYLGMSYIFANLGEDELSVNYLKVSMEKDVLLPEAYYLSGLLAERDEEWEKAIENYQRAIFLKSDFVMAHFNLASLFLKFLDLKNAERELKVVLQLLKNSPEKIYFSGGWSRDTLKDWAEWHLQKI